MGILMLALAIRFVRCLHGLELRTGELWLPTRLGGTSGAGLQRRRGPVLLHKYRTRARYRIYSSSTIISSFPIFLQVRGLVLKIAVVGPVERGRAWVG